MKNYLSELNPQQLEAVNNINGSIIVFAGAGAGKTKTLTYRISNMIDHKISPKNILAITFTNKARDEMKLRLLKLVGQDLVNDITICTFHSLCAKILRKEIHHLGYKNDFSIIDENESQKIIKDILEENIDLFDFDLKLKELYLKINSFKCYDKKSTFDMENDLLSLYNSKLKSYNVVDYEDLLLLTKTLFYVYPDVLKTYQELFQYILVDEFQDTNNIQYEIVRMLAIEHKNIFIVGDSNQSIYAFRGSNKDNIEQFKLDFNNYKEIILNQNYRSTQTILNKANNLIKVNGTTKEIYSEIDGTEYDVIPCEFENEYEETKFICNEIKQLIKVVNLKDIAILFRSNNVIKNIEMGLIKSNINYKIYGGQAYLKRKEVKDLIAYFRLIANPDDLYSFMRVVNIPNRKIGDVVINLIVDFKNQFNLSIFNVIKSLQSNISKNKYDQLISFYELIFKYNKLIEVEKLSNVLDKLLLDIDYIGYIQNESNLEERLENINEFKNILEYIESQTIIFKSEAINYIFDDLLLSEDKKSNVEKNAILLSTIHSSKGLEFDYVFLVGMEEGVFPNSLKFNIPQEIEEERRVCYVAMTRAKKKLYMTYAKKRMLYGKLQQFKKSRFIDESLGV